MCARTAADAVVKRNHMKITYKLLKLTVSHFVRRCIVLLTCRVTLLFGNFWNVVVM